MKNKNLHTILWVLGGIAAVWMFGCSETDSVSTGCQEGERSCQESDVLICVSNASWEWLKSCGEGERCSNGDCVVVSGDFSPGDEDIEPEELACTSDFPPCDLSCCLNSFDCCLQYRESCGDLCEWAEGRCYTQEHCKTNQVCNELGRCEDAPVDGDADEEEIQEIDPEPDEEVDDSETEEIDPNVCDPPCYVSEEWCVEGTCVPLCHLNPTFSCGEGECTCSTHQICIEEECIDKPSGCEVAGCPSPCMCISGICWKISCDDPAPSFATQCEEGWWSITDTDDCRASRVENEFCPFGQYCSSVTGLCQAMDCMVSCPENHRCIADVCMEDKPVSKEYCFLWESPWGF